jgi:hypothetical protein
MPAVGGVPGLAVTSVDASVAIAAAGGVGVPAGNV